MHTHALLHSSNELPSLYKLSYSSLTIKPPGYANLHGTGNLLNLSESILIYHRLSLVDGGAGTHSRDRGLLLGVLEDYADCSVGRADGYVYFVAEVKHWVERVVDGHLRRRDFLRSVPESGDLRTSGTGDL